VLLYIHKVYSARTLTERAHSKLHKTMKKSLLFVAIVATTIFFFGCSSSETATTTNPTDIPQLYVAGSDTVLSSQMFTLSPFTKEQCGKTIRGTYWNPTGFRYDTVRTQGAPISQDSLKKWFGKVDPSAEMKKRNNASFNEMAEWLKNLFLLLLAVLLLGIVIAFLIWALRSARASAQRSDFVATGALGTKADNQNTQSKGSHIAHTAEFGKEDYDGVIAIIAAAKNGPTGAYVKMGGAVEVFVPSSVPEINVSADRGSKVDINIEANTVMADMVDIHEGDDHRQYNRQTGSQKEKTSDKTDDAKN
jgi:hypothetical protein